MSDPICKICDEGTLFKKTVPKLGGCVSAIGMLLFTIPSILCFLVGGLLLFGTGSAVSTTSEKLKEEVSIELQAANIPQALINKIVEHEEIDNEEKAALTSVQKEKLRSAKVSYSAGTVGAGLGVAVAGGMSVSFFAAGLFGLLIGYLLSMKKTILQCDKCQAVVQAS